MSLKLKLQLINFLISLPFSLTIFARPIDTVYGTLEVEEPVLLELLDSSPMQRLKELHQYGIYYYLTGCEYYTRYDHSVGVFAILRMKGCPLEDQISGLLHDVSHTAFSHGGDYLFLKHSGETSYQDLIHHWYIEKSGLSKILEKHGISIDAVVHKPLSLEQDLPALCADRIDYNIQGAYLYGTLTQEDVYALVQDLEFDGRDWSFQNVELATKLSFFPLHMTFHCWSSDKNNLWNDCLSACLKRLMELKVITTDDIHFGTDEELLEIVLNHSDPLIAQKRNEMLNIDNFYKLSDQESGTMHQKIKCRGIDPWMRTPEGYVRLSKLDPAFFESFEAAKKRASIGWWIEFKSEK